jgi:hypothetical protein
MSHLETESGVNELSRHADSEPLPHRPFPHTTSTAASLDGFDRAPSDQAPQIINVKIASARHLLVSEHRFPHRTTLYKPAISIARKNLRPPSRFPYNPSVPEFSKDGAGDGLNS